MLPVEGTAADEEAGDSVVDSHESREVMDVVRFKESVRSAVPGLE